MGSDGGAGGLFEVDRVNCWSASRATGTRDPTRGDHQGLFHGFALLLAAVCLFPTAPAKAQNPVWSATLTVDEVSGYYGCDNQDSSQDNCSDALTEDEFDFSGATFAIERCM